MASPVCFLTMRMLLLFLLSLFHLRACYSSPSMQPLCHDDESYALLQFKESLVINESASYEPSAYPKVASWKVDGGSGDCCSWDGVKCDGDSGHVIGLDLSSSFLYGSIDSNSSLFHLVQLRRLNLADNDFNNSEIPSEIRNLSRLFDLDLSLSGFSGVIPSSLGNVTKLNYLYLSHNFFSGKIPPSLVNLFQLTYLSLSYNNFTSGTLHWLGNLTKLNYVDLARTNSYGEIPSCLGNLTQLTMLRLGKNELTGLIPESIFRLPNLETLGLQNNFFSGTVKFGLLKSRSLVSFQLSGNNLSVIGNHNDSAALPNIQILGLGGCNLSGEFPSFLHSQNHLEFVELSGNKIEGHIPKWFMNLGTETLWYLNLGANLLTGFEQPVGVLPWNNLKVLILVQNKLQGALPIPSPSILSYDTSYNRLTGEIAPAICNLTSLFILDLSHNNFNSKLPRCLGNISNTASVLDLRNNSFSGDIPEAFSSDCALRAIDFSQNQLEGKIPKTLSNCTKLEILNIEQNNINDVFPSWLGTLPKLRVLILRSSGIHGVMGKPKTNFEFSRLQIVDLSNNIFWGKLPLEYFRNWSAMKTIYKEHPLYMKLVSTFQIPGYRIVYSFEYSMTMTNKGVVTKYEKIQDSLTAIDLSSNRFEGGIPDALGDLKELHLLNLSNNFLSGGIPPSLSSLKELEALDLSQNKLSGEIPVQLAHLTFLEVFNVSHNFLSGPIPQGNQFKTFDNTSFDANPGLCGEPLSKECGNGEDSLPAAKEDEGSGFPLEFGWKVVVIIGYASGLVIGVILGCAMNTRKYEWLVKNYFARWQYKGQNLKTRLHRS